MFFFSVQKIYTFKAMGLTVNLGVAEKYSEYTSFPGFPDFFNTLNVFIVLSSGK